MAAVPERAVGDSVRRTLSLVVANEDTMWLIVEIRDAVVVVVIYVVNVVVVVVVFVVVVVMVVVEVDIVVVVVAATKHPNASFTSNGIEHMDMYRNNKDNLTCK